MAVAITKKTWIQLWPVDPKAQRRFEFDSLFPLVDGYGLAARSPRDVESLDTHSSQRSSLLVELEAWAEARPDAVSRAYFISKGDHYLFLVVQRSPTYDREFANTLADLDIKVANDPRYGELRLSVLAIPEAFEATVRSLLPGMEGVAAEDVDADRA